MVWCLSFLSSIFQCRIKLSIRSTGVNKGKKWDFDSCIVNNNLIKSLLCDKSCTRCQDFCHIILISVFWSQYHYPKLQMKKEKLRVDDTSEKCLSWVYILPCLHHFPVDKSIQTETAVLKQKLPMEPHSLWSLHGILEQLRNGYF